MPQGRQLCCMCLDAAGQCPLQLLLALRQVGPSAPRLAQLGDAQAGQDSCGGGLRWLALPASDDLEPGASLIEDDQGTTGRQGIAGGPGSSKKHAGSLFLRREHTKRERLGQASPEFVHVPCTTKYLGTNKDYLGGAVLLGLAKFLADQFQGPQNT